MVGGVSFFCNVGTICLTILVTIHFFFSFSFFLFPFHFLLSYLAISLMFFQSFLSLILLPLFTIIPSLLFLSSNSWIFHLLVACNSIFLHLLPHVARFHLLFFTHHPFSFILWNFNASPTTLVALFFACHLLSISYLFPTFPSFPLS